MRGRDGLGRTAVCCNLAWAAQGYQAAGGRNQSPAGTGRDAKRRDLSKCWRRMLQHSIHQKQRSHPEGGCGCDDLRFMNRCGWSDRNERHRRSVTEVTVKHVGNRTLMVLATRVGMEPLVQFWRGGHGHREQHLQQHAGRHAINGGRLQRAYDSDHARLCAKKGGAASAKCRRLINALACNCHRIVGGRDDHLGTIRSAAIFRRWQRQWTLEESHLAIKAACNFCVEAVR